MKLLILCFLGLAATTAGTIAFEGAVKNVCQTGVLIAMGVTLFLALVGQFK